MPKTTFDDRNSNDPNDWRYAELWDKDRLWERGMAARGKLGDLALLDDLDELAQFDPLLPHYLVEFLFGEILSRPHLQPKTRALCALAALVNQGDEDGTEAAIESALNAAATRQEIVEVIVQTSDRIIREGDPVVIDIGGCFNGYWGDFTRTYICGNLRPTDEQIELHQACYNALFNACGTARVGKTNYDVYMAAQPYVRDNLGHGAGVSPWEPPYFSASSKDEPVPLQKNMVLNLEPYAGKVGVGGFRLENNVIVTDGEPEIFTTLPFDDRLVKTVHPLDKTTGRRIR